MPQQFHVVSPVDASIVAHRTEATPGQIARALDAAQRAQGGWRATPLPDRRVVIQEAMNHMAGSRDEIAETLTMCMGRPKRWAGLEVDGMIGRAEHMMAIAPECLADIHPTPTGGFTRFIRREPMGVVMVLSPWNYPYLTAVNAVVPALLAGNAVILKHSDQTPLAAEHFAEAFAAAGLPKGVFQMLHMNHEATRQVLGDDCIDHVCFTGSVAGGVEVNRAIASRTGRKRFISAGLELGGNDPAYVRPDADIEFAAENIVEGVLFNSGQSCCGIERIYVHEDIATGFIDAAVAAAKAWTLGDPRDGATMLGPVVRQRNADAIRGQITRALESGARPLLDAAAWAKDRADTTYIAPQLLTNVDHSMAVMADETFGPCAGIMVVRNDQEAVRLMNDSTFGLTASIWSANEVEVTTLAEQVEAGTVFMNRCDYLDPALAWTGVKHSGRGVTLSSVGFEHLTRAKSFHFRTRVGA